MRLLIKIAIFLGILMTIAFFIVSWLTPQDPLKKADVIVAISGGDTNARTAEAVKLYKEGWAPQLLFSGAALDPLSPSNAAVMQEIGRAQGVPESAIDISEEATNTRENAVETQDLLAARDYDTIILITSPYHQRRAYLEFQAVFGPDVTIINHSSEDENWNEDWWFVSPGSWYLLGTETLKSGLTTIKGLF